MTKPGEPTRNRFSPEKENETAANTGSVRCCDGLNTAGEADIKFKF